MCILATHINATPPADLHTSSCRLAFYGRLCTIVDPSGAKLWWCVGAELDAQIAWICVCVAPLGRPVLPNCCRFNAVPALSLAAPPWLFPPTCCAADQQQLRRLLPVYKPKQREGVVERVEADGCTAVCRWVAGAVAHTLGTLVHCGQLACALEGSCPLKLHVL